MLTCPKTKKQKNWQRSIEHYDYDYCSCINKDEVGVIGTYSVLSKGTCVQIMHKALKETFICVE